MESARNGGDMGDLLYSTLTDKIIAAAFKVHNTLGKNLSENMYRNALVLQLEAMGLQAEAEKDLPVFFEQARVGKLRADVVVENKVVLELKAGHRITNKHLSKLLSALRNTRYQLGLVINFGPSVHIKRVINSIQNKRR